MAAAGLGSGLIMVFLIIGAAAYVYMSLALQTIADKTKTENSWLAWIPIANLVLMLNIPDAKGHWLKANAPINEPASSYAATV